MSRARTFIVIGLVTIVSAGVLGTIRAGLLPDWMPAEPWIGLIAATAGGSATLVTGVAERSRLSSAARQRSTLDLLDALKWQLFTNDAVSPFDVGFAVWVPRRDVLTRVRGRPQRLVAKMRERSRNRHASTGIEWTVGKGVIGRCIETGDIIGVDLEALWHDLRGCDAETWLRQDETDVRQGLSFTEFEKAQASGSVIHRGHLNFVIAVPILDDRSGVRGCVALDIPPGGVRGPVSENHYMVEGLRAIADSLGKS